MIAVLCLLAGTIYLFASEIVRVDVAAILVMVALGLLAQVPHLNGLADPATLFSGFSSNAVISIIAVMIIGAGLDKTGLMGTVAQWILRVGGRSEKRIIPLVSSTVAIISSFMQNVGAAALFVPVVSRISKRAELPLGRLLMPMGFCAILGGTMTMVGSSPLILLNDLIISANQQLPDGSKMETFGLFSVTPVGICLVITGILYFVFFSNFILPAGEKDGASVAEERKNYLHRLYGLDSGIAEMTVPEDATIVGRRLIDIHHEFNIYIVAKHVDGKTHIAPIALDELAGNSQIAVMGAPAAVRRFAVQNDLEISPTLRTFAGALDPGKVGVAEIVIPPDSDLIGRSLVDVRARVTYGFAALAIFRTGSVLSHIKSDDHEPTPIGLENLRSGDTLLVFLPWQRLNRLQSDKDFVVVTTDYPKEELRPQKLGAALFFFLVSLSLILFTDILLSLCLLTGAIGMIVSRVLRIDEAYEAVGWNTVFLLAALIPLGQAAQTTGTAQWIADSLLGAMGEVPVIVLQAGVALLATVFTLIMSNVGATVLLVPLAVNIALAGGGDPALFAMTVAISTSNSFLIPTHQVNALIMGPAGYKVKDFMRAGLGMTVLFLVVSLTMMNLVF